MSAEQVRETIQAYVEVLLARGDYGRFFADDIEFELMGTGQRTRGAGTAEQAIRFLHEIAFDAAPEVANVLVDDHGAGGEAMFVGTHVGEFSGIPATGNAVRVPYSVFYDVDAGTITALRVYMPIDQLVAQIRTPAAGEVAEHTA
ncbi:MAG: ester cyclase [Solirubrobacteraceae bacterium]